MKLKVGCCGFAVSHKEYFREFGIVELQSAFYQLPRLKTAARWREEAPSNFEFAVKAWQAITHPISSPTWRKVKALPPVRYRTKYGLLQPTRQNFEARNGTLAVCRVLRATVCVVQCPPRFSFTNRNVHNLKEFFANIDRDGLVIVWEPRGDWIHRPQEIRSACKRLELVHCVDLLRRDPAHIAELGYIRLHGLGSKEYNYSYRYSDLDLSELLKRLTSLSGRELECAYVMFNNIAMFQDARRFLTHSCVLSK